MGVCGLKLSLFLSSLFNPSPLIKIIQRTNSTTIVKSHKKRKFAGVQALQSPLNVLFYFKSHQSLMKELALKYGCNPNQKPSRIYMTEGELPIEVLTVSRHDI